MSEQLEVWQATKEQILGAGGAPRVRRKGYTDGEAPVASMGHLQLKNVNGCLEKKDVRGQDDAARAQFRNQNLHVEMLQRIRESWYSP